MTKKLRRLTEVKNTADCDFLIYIPYLADSYDQLEDELGTIDWKAYHKDLDKFIENTLKFIKKSITWEGGRKDQTHLGAYTTMIEASYEELVKIFQYFPNKDTEKDKVLLYCDDNSPMFSGISKINKEILIQETAFSFVPFDDPDKEILFSAFNAS